jgi:hypothetical protein
VGRYNEELAKQAELVEREQPTRFWLRLEPQVGVNLASPCLSEKKQAGGQF